MPADEIYKSYYAVIPANVRYDEELTPNAKLLYGEITALCNEKGYCWASNDYFAQLYKVSKKSVSTWINQLKDKKYITSEIIYRDGTKEILHRYLRISQYPSEENFHTRIEENVSRGIEEKVKDNNTLVNNTINNTTNNIVVQVIEYLNNVCSTKYKPSTAKTKQLITARVKEGYELDDFKKVIFTMYTKWKGTEWEQYLRPSTLFNSEKFEGYLNQYKGQSLEVNNAPKESEPYIPY